MTRRLWLVADDYGLSPAVSGGIRELLDLGSLSGTGCMTIFQDWSERAAELRANRALAGLHLTLTDQPSLAGGSLSRSGNMPTFGRLVVGLATKSIAEADIHAELDAQLARFTDAMGQMPIYMDGHQHVHFLKPVRSWFVRVVAPASGPLPWLRGAPKASLSPKGSSVRIGAVAAFARGFAKQMTSAGYVVRQPLAGFYDWTSGRDFPATVGHALRGLPDGGVLMVHPGHVDQILRSRDILTDTREIERDFLASTAFRDALAASGAVIAK